jgi:hypothetical protein
MVDAFASALLEHETLDEADTYAAAGPPRAATPITAKYLAAGSLTDRYLGDASDRRRDRCPGPQALHGSGCAPS